MSKWIKNNSGTLSTYGGQDIADGTYYEIQTHQEREWANMSLILTDVGSGDAVIAKDDSGSTDIVDVNTAISYLKGDTPKDVIITAQTEPHPFAAPDYRTKRDATTVITTIAINDNAAVDFQLTAERYVSGGKLIIKNAEFGDYCTAEVHDTDAVIPEAYRASMCENWPTVSSYIIKEWIEVSDGTLSKHTIDTRPLNAKITAGLYLRVTYYAINTGSSREVAINYDLTQKLV